MTVERVVVRNGTNLWLLLGLSLTSYLGVSGGMNIENVKISTDDDTTRPVTTIRQGTLQGVNMLTRLNRTFYGFIGIPFAQPPIGDLRFKPPVSPEPWNGTLDASTETEPCPQLDDDGGFAGDEDCLHLNVFTPQLPTDENVTLLPVMMYVIGGAFLTENNSPVAIGPEFLLDKDVLLVVANFRVGVLGYLSTGDDVSPGNYGLKDIVQTLKWIQENIEHFGGDPDQVTLFGGSSGATSVHLLALSNSTDGLFHRYITQSGVAVGGLLESPISEYVDRAFQLGEHLNCPTNTSTLLVDCLRSLNASQLINANSIFYKWKTYPTLIWKPSLEPDIEGALLTDSPTSLYAAGKIRDLPWMSSVNKDEGIMSSMSFHQDPDLLEEFLEQIDDVLPIVLGYEGTVDNQTAYTNALKSYYLNDLSANRSLLLNNLTLLMGDLTFIYPAYNAFKQQLSFAKNPLYFCSFEYRGTFSYTYLFSGGSTEFSTKVAHGDETIYIFQTHDSRFGPSDYENTEDDWEMVETMVQLWTSFATNGTPTTVESGTVWEPFSSDNNYLRIGNGSDTTIEMASDFLEERMQFWDSLTAKSSSSMKTPIQSLYYVVLCLWLIFHMRL